MKNNKLMEPNAMQIKIQRSCLSNTAAAISMFVWYGTGEKKNILYSFESSVAWRSICEFVYIFFRYMQLLSPNGSSSFILWILFLFPLKSRFLFRMIVCVCFFFSIWLSFSPAVFLQTLFTAHTYRKTFDKPKNQFTTKSLEREISKIIHCVDAFQILVVNTTFISFKKLPC